MALVVLLALAASLAAQILVVSGFEHRAAQQVKFDQLRKELAETTAPLGPTDRSGHLLPLGTPIAIIDIPSIGVHQVVVEGTSAGVLMSGPGHSRTSPFPGQAGTSTIYGRQASYGGPFSRIYELRVGQRIVVTTGEGTSTFKVIDVRHAGSPLPPALASGQGRLLLITADGTPYIPSGVLHVDADLTSQTLAGPATVVPNSALALSEKVMVGDPSTVWALVLLLQALIVISIGVVWSWHGWGRQQTWIVFFPLTALVGLFAAHQVMKLLPNLL